MQSGHNHKYWVVGMMSGTSLDGIDLVLCQFTLTNGKWAYHIEMTETIAYSNHWQKQLGMAHRLPKNELTELDRDYGKYIGQCVKSFLGDKNADLIASHGHTVFHRPYEGITLQIGHGQSIFEETGITVVNDFRSMDVKLGGQGAPLVPVGDELLFATYDYCLNLGGFSNISCRRNNKRIAWDICPVNIILNKLCPPYDNNGEKGRKGKICSLLLEQLNCISYYHKYPPKSLGREWLENEFESVLAQFDLCAEDKLTTVYEHIAIQIGKTVQEKGSVLVTGGGAWNTFLMELLNEKCDSTLLIPDAVTVNYKEALIFAFIGVLRMRNEINCLAFVTGASRDSCCGIIHRS